MAADMGAVESILRELRELDDIIDVTLVSRSGMHIAGNTPSAAHGETYVAMTAIVLGAAETISNEVKDGLESVVLNLNNMKVIVQQAGAKAVVVVSAKSDAPLIPLIEDIKQAKNKLAQKI